MHSLPTSVTAARGAKTLAVRALRRFAIIGPLLGAPVRGRLALASAVALLMAAAPAGTVHSNLFIEPGKQFILGGEQRGAFRVAAKNVGAVPVDVKERPRGGGIFGKATLAPGQKAVLRFAAGSTAVLLNPSAAQANLDLTITGDTKLGMNYEPVGQTAPGALK